MRKSFLIMLSLTVCFFLVICNLPEKSTDREVWQEKIDNRNYYVLEEDQKKYQNSDLVGKVIIDTVLEEPILQTSDNQFYLNHDIKGNTNINGATFLDYRVEMDSRKTLIYGHNSDKLDLPFSVLEHYMNQDYLKEHPFVEVDLFTKKKMYEIFSVFVETSDWSYTKILFSNEDEWYQHLLGLKNKSLYDTGVDVLKTDTIVVLQTCSKNEKYQEYAKKYLLVVAKEIKDEI